MNYRMERVNAALQREIGELITTKLLDPRVASLTSVTSVKTSRDLALATVYVSVLGTEEQQRETLKGLDSAANMIRGSLKSRIRMRTVPHLCFELDNTMARGAEVISLIDRVIEEREANRPLRVADQEESDT